MASLISINKQLVPVLLTAVQLENLIHKFKRENSLGNFKRVVKILTDIYGVKYNIKKYIKKDRLGYRIRIKGMNLFFYKYSPTMRRSRILCLLELHRRYCKMISVH